MTNRHCSHLSQVWLATIPFSVNGVSHIDDGAWSVSAGNESGRTAPWGGTVWLILKCATTAPLARWVWI